ncbi:mitochondrial fission 1 protein, putative [Pediculus humanus corporis]|uniref:Mitochondrial fission 1 protein n=1 Tax=Pediculus humanus subsp. corporis TaxID=121224 RepID=E0VVN5_PEDHC|nr:mitochondrial fission 1 protein, putative [Pediculus humanus corporis]EEB17441.1 mitochondrial fission 1 protein, putative [Pediculus humanus corporis]
MEELLNETISEDDLKKFERIYSEQLKTKDESVSPKAQFEYAWCLIRSKYPADIKKGIILLEELCSTNIEGRRDYIYYLAIGHTRMKEYTKALEYCRVFLEIEPFNSQVQDLEKIIKKKMNKEGTIGMAITVAGALIVGGIVTLGVALSKSKN